MGRSRDASSAATPRALARISPLPTLGTRNVANRRDRAMIRACRPLCSEMPMSALDAFGLSGNVAIVTGAGHGIGRAIAETFAAAGAAVMVSDLDFGAAQAVAAGIRAAGGRAACAACDVTNGDARMQLVEEAVRAFGGITLLVNNAGGGGPQPFEMPLPTFARAYELNVFSVFAMTQLCVPLMERAGGGAIVNISSMAGENRNVRMAAYASAKAAENHLTRNLACDLGPKGIRVNAVAPGAVRTAALASVLTPEIERAMLRRTPLARLGEPRDIACAALFLCSPAASWISGQVLTVSGGGTQELD
jgi:7-alpha-hydroxysteroid dehydrogenase